MLGKLMRYDMKYMARVLPWLYLGALAISLFISLFGALSASSGVMELMIFVTLGILPLSLMVAAISVCGTVFMMIRIYKNMFSDEGYLTFTLPVTPGSVIWSKLLTGAIWNFIGGAVTIAVVFMPITAILAAFSASDPKIAEGISLMLEGIRSMFEMIAELPGFGWNVFIWIVSLIVGLFSANAIFMFSCCLAQFSNKNRGIASVGIYLGIKFVLSLINSGMSRIGITELTSFSPANFEEFCDSVMNRVLTSSIPSVALTLTVAALAIIFSYRIIKNKLNMI